MKLLIIEDERGIASALKRGLHRRYIVDLAATGTLGLQKAGINDYAVIILDLGLPDMPGLQVCKLLREEGSRTPILVLTAEGEVRHKVELLDAGADDYLTKPFSMEELQARLRVLGRRNLKKSRSSRLVVGDLTMDTVTRRIERAGTPIRLRRKEFDLLEYMMHHAGTVLSRATLVDHIWDMNDSLWTNSVDVHIKYLRDKIDRPFAHVEPMIKTVHGVGYKLETSNSVASTPK